MFHLWRESFAIDTAPVINEMLVINIYVSFFYILIHLLRCLGMALCVCFVEFSVYLIAILEDDTNQ